MMPLPISLRLFLSVAAAGALLLCVTACTDNSPGGVEPTSIPPNASTGPGNAFAPASADGTVGTADTGFPSNSGGNGVNAPGH